MFADPGRLPTDEIWSLRAHGPSRVDLGSVIS